jgi:dTDP-4-amino-4,6-dideoxygalactose transaminase
VRTDNLVEAPPVPFVDMQAVNLPLEAELTAAFRRVLATGDFGHGPTVEAFEALLAEEVGVRHAVGVNSGTAALHLTLVAAGIGPGCEVIVPANTFFATAEAVLLAGADVVLVDPDLDTALAAATTVEASIGPRTAAIIGVHLYGQPVDACAYRQVAERHGLLFIEDAAQAIGASISGRPAGSLGAAAGFSFYPTKNLGALGQGGAVTTNDGALAREVRLLRSHGEEERYTHLRAGFNERMHGLQAAFLAVKLPYLADQQRERDATVARYDALLADLPGCRRIVVREGIRSAHHLLVVRVAARDEVLALLHSEGVAAAIHYPIPIHLQPACAGLAAPGSLPNAERLAREILSLPLFTGIVDAQIERCVDVLRTALDRYPSPQMTDSSGYP